MDHPPLFDFRLRADYPNFESIRRFISGTVNESGQDPLSHNLLPELEYCAGENTPFITIPITYADVRMLTRHSSAESFQYLELLVLASHGDQKASARISRMKEKY